MANHTITIVNKSDGGEITKPGGKNNVDDKIKKSLFKNIISGVKTGRSLLSMGTLKKVAPIFVALQAAKVITDFSANYMEAKTGDSMRFHNMKSMAGFLANPFSTAKTLIWDYSIIEPMRLARQNESLNYDRQLTGNVIYSGNKQKGVF